MLHVVDRSRSLVSMRMSNENPDLINDMSMHSIRDKQVSHAHIPQVCIHVHAHVDADRFACHFQLSNLSL